MTEPCHFKDGACIHCQATEQGACEGWNSPASCAWKNDDDGTWHTSCGGAFVFTNDDDPKENGFKYCCYCGAKLEVKE